MHGNLHNKGLMDPLGAIQLLILVLSRVYENET
jgi:hypothetical protein